MVKKWTDFYDNYYLAFRAVDPVVIDIGLTYFGFDAALYMFLFFSVILIAFRKGRKGSVIFVTISLVINVFFMFVNSLNDSPSKLIVSRQLAVTFLLYCALFMFSVLCGRI